MAERKATNKYYPPDWDPKDGSINKYKNSHHLRARARKLDEGILVVRFEMPFNVWCSKCNNHVAMGVRYNAEKTRVGSYYTSPIYLFKMKCHLCDNFFQIQTDPSKFDYVILSGARKQCRAIESQEAGLVLGEDDSSKLKVADAMSRLEKKVEDEMQSHAQLPSLQELKRWRSRWEDNFSANQLVRSQYRERRKAIEKKKEQNKSFQAKTSLKLSISDSIPEDKVIARKIFHQSKSAKLDNLEQLKKEDLLKSAALRPLLKLKKEKVIPRGSPSTSTRSRTRIKKEPG